MIDRLGRPTGIEVVERKAQIYTGGLGRLHIIQ